jgi:hypothetical protein
MNYQKIYNQIIERAKIRQIKGYTEKHHIIPKCLGGSNDEENLIELTAREHFLCHILLVEIYPNEPKLKWAIYNMSNYKKYKVNSREYERLKIEFISLVKGKPRTQETRDKIGKAHKGKTISEKTLILLRKPKSEEVKLNMRKPKSTTINMFGSKSDIHKLNMRKPKPTNFGIEQSLRLKGKSKKSHTEEHKINLSTPILQYSMDGDFIKEWTGIKKAGIELNICSNSISCCCRGKYKKAGNYIWKYKN